VISQGLPRIGEMLWQGDITLLPRWQQKLIRFIPIMLMVARALRCDGSQYLGR